MPILQSLEHGSSIGTGSGAYFRSKYGGALLTRAFEVWPMDVNRPELLSEYGPDGSTGGSGYSKPIVGGALETRTCSAPFKSHSGA